jgi:YVTN family beta-propeller protein
MTLTSGLKNLLLTTALLLAATSGETASTKGKPESAGAPKPARIERQGVTVEFSANRYDPTNKTNQALQEGEYADVRFKVTDARTRKPLGGLRPGAWLDLEAAAANPGKEDPCKSKIETYLKGVVGVRPALDLTSYFLLIFNQDASISVVDPLVGVAGKTNLFTTIIIKHPAADWAKSTDGRHIYVSQPAGGLVAVIDTETFKVIDNLDVGGKPTRLALQRDGRYLWVGDDKGDQGGVTVIDTQTNKIVSHVPTGRGHHEMAFSADDRLAFVSNRDDGGISVIDIGTTRKLKDIQTGKQPISLVYSQQARALYVADGATGAVTVISGDDPAIVATTPVKPGLGPMGLTPDDRWLLVLNPPENQVHVLDLASNRLVQDIPVGSRPYQIAFSERFAYVRSLDTEQVAMISLSLLGTANAVNLSTFAAGSLPPRDVPDLGIGATMAPAVGEAAYLVTSPADNLVYYYMEGMLAPSGNFRNPGHNARGVTLVDRSLRETQPGVYSARVKLPSAGDYDVAFLLESPRMIGCFRVHAKPNPLAQDNLLPLEIDYLNTPTSARVGDKLLWRFRLDDTSNHQPKTGLKDVRVLHYLSPGLFRTEVTAQEVGKGIYQVEVPIVRNGAYVVMVAVPSLKLKFGELSFRNVLAIGKASAQPMPQKPVSR